MADFQPTTEDWRPVIGYEGVYDVSDNGRVRRCRSRRILRQNPNGIGYASVCLTTDGISRTVRVHMLVATAFLGRAPEGCEINHRDGDKMNPRADNLEYVTHTENVGHAIATGLHNPSRPGIRNGGSVLTEDAVRAIRRDAQTLSYSQLVTLYGISKSQVARIVNGESWRHLSGLELPTQSDGR